MVVQTKEQVLPMVFIYIGQKIGHLLTQTLVGEKDIKELVETAHKNRIRILLDDVINHTGPLTEKDPVCLEEWLSTEAVCTYQVYESTITCTLVKNLP